MSPNSGTARGEYDPQLPGLIMQLTMAEGFYSNWDTCIVTSKHAWPHAPNFDDLVKPLPLSQCPVQSIQLYWLQSLYFNPATKTDKNLKDCILVKINASIIMYCDRQAELIFKNFLTEQTQSLGQAVCLKVDCKYL